MNFEQRYPEIFDKFSDISYPQGWETILDNVFKIIVWTSKQQHEAMIRRGDATEFVYPKISQVKEKFGTLRIYADYITDYQHGAINMAENMSAVTCEVCGDRGTLRGGGWLRTLCDYHYAGVQALEELSAQAQQQGMYE
jgi:hypothetical protein